MTKITFFDIQTAKRLKQIVVAEYTVTGIKVRGIVHSHHRKNGTVEVLHGTLEGEKF